MRNLVLIIAGTVLLAGCASLEEAYYLDREFGQASKASWDKQIAFPDSPHAGKTPEGTEGITAEEIMNVYNETFAEEPEQINIFQLDVMQ